MSRQQNHACKKQDTKKDSTHARMLSFFSAYAIVRGAEAAFMGGRKCQLRISIVCDGSACTAIFGRCTERMPSL